MNDLLERIIHDKREETAERKRRLPICEIEPALLDQSPPRGFLNALQNSPHPVALIAEIKRASPSKGVFTDDFRPADIARRYEQAGADCLSVLTDERYFQGHTDHLQMARLSVSLPVLRKDFIIDPYQIHESRWLGADAILLIVAAIPEPNQLRDWREEAQNLGMDTLVEIHTEQEAEIALKSGAFLIGINNRNLQTFETNLETTFQLRALLPPGITVVSESGIQNAAHVQKLKEAQVRTMLVGESLMREADPTTRIHELLSIEI